MKTQGKFIIRLVTVVMLLFQLMSPALARADGETPPPTDLAPTESPGDSASPADDPDETDTPTETPAPAPTESPTLEDPPGTPPPTDSSTPGTPSNTPAPIVTDSGSPTSDPVETSAPTQTPTRERTRRPTETTNSRFEPLGPATEETIVTESGMPTETPTPEPTETALPTETVTAEPPTLLESVQAIPGDTSVVVLDANGQPLPLVTQEAADIVANSDPMWCPAGAPPIPMGFPYFGSCTPSYVSMSELLINQGTFINSQNVNGTIWITAGNVTEPGLVTSVTIDGLVYANWANYSLNLQGGWDGAFGSMNIVSNSVFSVPIEVTNWNNGITIQNIDAPSITISDAMIQNNGISVFNTSSEVNLRRINVNRTDGVFGHGVQVITSGNINLEDITATANSFTQGDGAFLVNSSGTGNVTLTGTNIFSNHHYYSSGMYIVSNGTVSLSDITSSNSGRGVNISQAGNVSVTNGTFNDTFFNGLYVTNAAGDVSLNGISIDGANGVGTGLYVDTLGAIIANNISSNNNNSGGGCPIACGMGAYLSGANGVTLNGTNVFNSNASSGLDTRSSYGVATLNNITASNNLGGGAYLTGTNGVTLTGTNIFNNNGWTGLDAWSSNGAVSLENVTASNNLSYGAFLTSANSLTLTGTNEFSGNGQTGLDAWSFYGDVTLNNVTASNNLGYGAAIHGADVTLNGNIVFNENSFAGLVVSGSGNVAVNDVTADGNNGIQSYGVMIFDSGNVYLTGGAYTGNGIGLYVQCVNSVTFNLPQTQIINNIFQDILIDPTCPVPITYPIPTIISISHGEKEFVLDCKSVDGFSVNLPNGDLVYIYCPVTGNAKIARMDSTALPADLPAGFTYASAFSLDILQNKESIDVIPETEGGSIKASFVGSSLQPGSTYSILFWDEDKGSWEPLEEFMLDVRGKPLAFDLNPGMIPEDKRQILSGVELVTVNGLSRVEVSTNFPGIFVLAQR